MWEGMTALVEERKNSPLDVSVQREAEGRKNSAELLGTHCEGATLLAPLLAGCFLRLLLLSLLVGGRKLTALPRGALLVGAVWDFYQ
jgi:hypothetical protein